MLPMWRYLTLTQNLGLNILTSGTFSHAWSLCAEEHFYLVLPVALAALLASGLFKKALWLPLALFLLTLLLRSYFWNHDYLPNIHSDNATMLWYKYVYYPTYCRADGLLVGITAAATFHFAPKSWAAITRSGNAAFVAALLVLSAAYVLCLNPLSYPASVFGFSVVAMGYGMLLISALSRGCFLFKWQSKYTGYLSTLSYAVYLTHKGIIHITQSVGSNFGVDPEGSAIFVLCILACLTGAAILYLAIERPFMAIRNRILRN